MIQILSYFGNKLMFYVALPVPFENWYEKNGTKLFIPSFVLRLYNQFDLEPFLFRDYTCLFWK